MQKGKRMEIEKICFEPEFEAGDHEIPASCTGATGLVFENAYVHVEYEALVLPGSQGSRDEPDSPDEFEVKTVIGWEVEATGEGSDTYFTDVDAPKALRDEIDQLISDYFIDGENQPKDVKIKNMPL